MAPTRTGRSIPGARSCSTAPKRYPRVWASHPVRRPDRPGSRPPSGDSIHGWIDPLLGLSRSERPPVDEVRIVREEAVLGPPGGLRVRVRRVDGTPAPSVPVTVYAPRGATAPTMQWTERARGGRVRRTPFGPRLRRGGGRRGILVRGIRFRARRRAGAARRRARGRGGAPRGLLRGPGPRCRHGGPRPERARGGRNRLLPPEAGRGPRWFQFGKASADGPRGSHGHRRRREASGSARSVRGAPYELSARAGDGRRGSIGYAPRRSHAPRAADPDRAALLRVGNRSWTRTGIPSPERSSASPPRGSRRTATAPGASRSTPSSPASSSSSATERRCPSLIRAS